jgi:hypothetical protein
MAQERDEDRRPHRRRRDRGYEAGDDTDSTPDDTRRRANGPVESRDRERDRERDRDDEGRRRHHRRRRSHDPSSSSAGAGVVAGASSSSTSRRDRRKDKEGTVEGNDSDTTVDLPPRFDEEGRKKADRGEDPFADKLEDIIAGKGTAGKVFGNFVDGLFGPERGSRGGGGGHR